MLWIPAFAGMTIRGLFTVSSMFNSEHYSIFFYATVPWNDRRVFIRKRPASVSRRQMPLRIAKKVSGRFWRKDNLFGRVNRWNWVGGFSVSRFIGIQR